MPINTAEIRQMVEEINDDAEKNRRALSKRRHDIYKDGGRAFLIEQIIREFGQDALKEMRLAPINLLKKIVNKRSQVYKRAPKRKTELESNQLLVDFYTEELSLNTLMQKANKYYTLHSNCAIYNRPVQDKEGYFCLKADVVVPYLYSIRSELGDKTEINTYVFNQFVEEGRVTPQANVPSATGQENFSLERGYKTGRDLVDSNEISTDEQRQYIFWTDESHFTTDDKGAIILHPELDETQLENPIGIKPVVNVAKDRDNEPWATQGEDMIDLTIALQLGWTDLLTIAKHQGFSLLTVASEEEPKRLTMGINKAIWLKTMPNGGDTRMEYVQAQSPLDQYKALLMELLGILLSTNDMEPGSISGAQAAQKFTSGFHQLISMSDNLDAIEADKPAFLDAEKDHWEIIAAWHNYLYDSGSLSPEAQALGRFTDDFDVNIEFASIRPLESEQERLDLVKEQRDMGLMTRLDAIKKLYPDLSEEEAAAKLAEIDAEKQTAMTQLQSAMANPFGQSANTTANPPTNQPGQLN